MQEKAEVLIMFLFYIWNKAKGIFVPQNKGDTFHFTKLAKDFAEKPQLKINTEK